MLTAASATDMHTCPMWTGVVPHIGGPILPPGCPTVLIATMPVARMGDMGTCTGTPDTIGTGVPTILIGGMPAARMTGQPSHGGIIILGAPTVFCGGAASPARPRRRPGDPPATRSGSMPGGKSEDDLNAFRIEKEEAEAAEQLRDRRRGCGDTDNEAGSGRR